jgi:low affinity Fe/Cu permease
MGIALTVEHDATKDQIHERRTWVDQRRNEHPPSRWRRGIFAAEAPRSRSRVLTDHGEAWSDRTPSSRALHRVGEITSCAAAGVVVATALAAWVVVGFVTGFPRWWEGALYATGTCVTLVMVFAIQHTQSRQETAIQRKLDELLRTMPHADHRLIAAEDAPDDELEARAQLNRADRTSQAPDADEPVLRR